MTGRRLFPMLTQQAKVPLVWIALINFLWFTGLYTLFVISTALPFTMRRFTDDTRLMSLVGSVGLWFGIVLGPLVNYISDRIWTRFGRRRPFILVAVCGALLAMVCIPFMPALAPLIMVVVVSSILGDVGSTQEPLWLEVVPPSQRGTGVAIRVLAINMAGVLFFQVMFAQFDRRYQFGGLALTGEQMCYLLGAFFQFCFLLLIAFGIREVRPGGVQLRHPGEVRSEQLLGTIRRAFAARRWWHYLLCSPLPVPWMIGLAERSGQRWLLLLLFPAAFAVRYCRDVFGEGRWWWVYLYYISGTFLTSGGGFVNLMLVEQFHYDKPRIALTGVPLVILGNLVMTPFLAWFSDRLPRFSPWLLGALTCGCGAALWHFLGWWSHVPTLELPPFWAMMILATLIALTTGAGLIWLFQIARGLTPGMNPRVWAFGLNTLAIMAITVVTYATIRASDGHVPRMTVWFALLCAASGIQCLSITAGPLLYDLIPKDKLGTLSSGFGLLATVVSALISTLVGPWIFYFTKWTTGSATAPKDYSSFYLMQVAFGLITIGLTVMLVHRFIKGRMVEYGRLGLNADDPVPAAASRPPATVAPVP